MFQYTATLSNQSTAIAALETEDPNEVTSLSIQGEAASELVTALDGSYGPYGHLFDLSGTTAIDLDFVLKGLENWQVESTGNEVSTYDPAIPAGALT
ncbi:MAG: hypothetical protein AAGB19_03575 [Cyanobacteria bacterium P01_F01_bin.3]